jgi:predicted RNA-binding Zn-ribbon protein involved in translation (DUF1610 family)
MIENTDHTAGQARLPSVRPLYGVFRCPYCANDELVDSDGHEHDGFCGDREWVADLPPLWMATSHVCPCCGRPADFIGPLELT